MQVIALTTAIGVVRGTNSEPFALGLVFSLVVRPALALLLGCSRALVPTSAACRR